jgi:hypothetical protein
MVGFAMSSPTIVVDLIVLVALNILHSLELWSQSHSMTLNLECP